ncbi:hypothetical protein BJ912DRAFT_955454 [Pholiota molesta]|nr:hypothetical protein BJ912DRAFT_955454 [Pholiota molesta]
MVQEGKDHLMTHVSSGALYNSNERRDYSRRHPETRVQLVDDIMNWLDTVEDPRLVLHLKGPAGLGKSVIAEAIATSRLLGAFFVSGNATEESGRNDELRVQPFVFDMDIATQVEELILGPLSVRSDEMLTSTPPMLFILDALDEVPDKAAQKRIVEAFCVAMERVPRQIPFKLFITSRPDPTIHSALMAAGIAPLVHTISLSDYPAHGDIRTFFVERFRDLRRTHPSPDIFPPIWPTEDTIDELVKRSSGHFLYAAQVFNYIQADDADPTQRLQAFLAWNPFSDFRDHLTADIQLQHYVIYLLPLFFF